jgi:predicted ABC-type ATPase
MATAAPKVVLIGGPNGAGKSTLAPYLLRDHLGVADYVNADVIATGLSAYAPESVAFAAGRIMLTRLRELAETGQSFAFESTLATRSYTRWLRKLISSGYSFQLVFLWLQSPELAVERVRERVRRGGHDIPQDVVVRRYHRGQRNFLRLYSPLAAGWSVLDNSSESGPTLIATGSSGDVVDVAQPDLWNAFTGVQE